MLSIQKNLTLSLALALVALLIIQWGIITHQFEKLLIYQIRENLINEADSLLTHIVFDQDGSLRFDQDMVSERYRQPFSGYYYQIHFTDQTYYSRSIWDYETDLSLEDTDSSGFIAGPQSQELYYLARNYRKKDQHFQIFIAQDIKPLLTEQEAAKWKFSSLSIVIILAIITMVALLIRRAFKPVAQIHRDLKALRDGKIAQLHASSVVEYSALIEELNQLLTKMQQRAQRSREALGNLAHAMKTRLSLINQLADEPTLKNAPSTRRRLIERSQSLQVLIDQELKRARLLGRPLPGQRLVLHQEIEQLVSTLKLIYRDKPIDFSITVPEKNYFFIEREDAVELMGNLLDNACKFCRHRVEIYVSETDSAVHISVNDDGAGCDEEECNALMQRGHRLDETISGSGLGLSIVQDILSSYEAELTISRSQLGGLAVEMQWPKTLSLNQVDNS